MKRLRTVVVLLFIKHFYIKFIAAAEGSELKGHHQFIGHNGNCDNSCFSVVVEILQVVHKFHAAGQVLVSSDWFHKLQYPPIRKFNGESIDVPLLVYSKVRDTTTCSFNASLATFNPVNRFVPSRFVHLQEASFLPYSLSPSFITAQLQLQTWRRILYLTFRQGMRIPILDLEAPGKRARLIAAWNTLVQDDLFILTFNLFQLLESTAFLQKSDNSYVVDNSLILPHHRGLRERANSIIWVDCSAVSEAGDTYNYTFGLLNKRQLRIYSSSRGLVDMSGSDALAVHIDRFHQLLGRHPETMDRSKSQLSILIKRQGGPLPSHDVEESNASSSLSTGASLTRHPVSRKGFLYSSLVFITKKPPDSQESPGGVWGPFSIAAWLGILAAYTITAIFFGLIKLVTMNNLENSWYDWIISRLLSVMYEDKEKEGETRASHVQEQKAQGLSSISSSTVGICMLDENANEIKRNGNHQLPGYSMGIWEGAHNEGSQNLVTRRVSVKSSTASQQHIDDVRSSDCENQEAFVSVKCRQSRGKMSRTILYGTIRLVSFIILGLYEGNLYTTITFPKSKLVASFDELISSDKYLIKVSSEATKFENITARIKANSNASFHDDQVSPSSFPRVVPTSGGRLAGASHAAEGRLVESVNILDCVNWVEAGPDPNHACVGYEFELRNLHKAQKSDKILVRSKQRLLKFGPGGGTAYIAGGGGYISSSSSSSTSSSISARILRSRRRGFTLFPGGLQISKWILESGILQLWSIVENAFMESVINPHWSDPFKVFTIRDYLGLFVVYSMLLILSSIMFLLEHVVTLMGKMANSQRLSKAWRCLRDKCISLGKGCRGMLDCCGILGNSNKSYKSRGRDRNRFRFALDSRRGRKYFRSWSPANGIIAV